MKKAIITGATGLIGTAVARHLVSLGIEVLCLGRQKLSPADINRLYGTGINYLRLDMEDIASLAERIDMIAWPPGDECVFFNFAWRGCKKLTDGTFGEQFKNAVQAAEAVRSAKKLGCIKFVNAGTLEETFVEQFLEQRSYHPYTSAQTDYALAKLASRDMCKMVAYLEKIDYVHARLSVPLALNLTQGNYVARTLKKISEGKPYDQPVNKQLLDIVYIDDVARAFSSIGISGKNKADYYIGTSTPATLGQYFEMFERFVNSNFSHETDIPAANHLEHRNIETLYRDTGFIATTRFKEMINKLQNP